MAKLKTALERNSLPTIWNDPLSVSPVPVTSVYVNVSNGLASVVLNVPTAVPLGWFSAIAFADKASAVGVAGTSSRTMYIAPRLLPPVSSCHAPAMKSGVPLPSKSPIPAMDDPQPSPGLVGGPPFDVLLIFVNDLTVPSAFMNSA